MNQAFSRDCAEPGVNLSQPASTLGRGVPPKELVVLVAIVKESGTPVWNVLIRFKPHPDTSFPATPEALPRNALPFPMGRS